LLRGRPTTAARNTNLPRYHSAAAAATALLLLLLVLLLFCCLQQLFVYAFE
jgi:hypothetical protein